MFPPIPEAPVVTKIDDRGLALLKERTYSNELRRSYLQAGENYQLIRGKVSGGN